MQLENGKGEQKIGSLDEMRDALDKSDGWMVGVTLLKDGQLRHFLLTQDFFSMDLFKSWQKVRGLIIEQLEREAEM